MPSQHTPAAAGPIMLVLIVLAVALAVRAQRWTEGFPAFMDEAQPLRQALKMWRPGGVIDWNPHFFVYPSLAIYVHLALQWVQLHVGTATGAYGNVADFLLAFETDPGAHALVSRVAVTAVDLGTILGTIVLGERLARGAGVAAGLVVALAPTGIATSRAIYVEAYLALFAVWAIERMVAAGGRTDRGPLLSAGALVGLATSSKYPGALLAIPLLWTALRSPGPAEARIRRAAGAIGIAVASFAVTSPFVLLDWSTAEKDLRFTADLARHGHLGHLGRESFGFYAAQLARDPGLLVLILFALFLVVAWRDREARPIGVLLLLATCR